MPRERLFSLLDERRRHPAIWISAPPGAGKTTLVGSWLESRKLTGIWYQVDAGDADPASFFYYLGLAEQALPRRRRGLDPLPLLTPEYLPDRAGFARRFFRELFTRLDPTAVLVLDNFQEAGADEQFHEIVQVAMDNLPPGITLIVISRADPGDSYVHHLANRTAVLIDWGPLKLTREESRWIAQSHLHLDAQVVDLLHDRAAGWTAGLILLAERASRDGTVESIESAESEQEVFAYFAGQMFDRSDEATRYLLLKLSYLPVISARAAERLTGTEASVRLLEQMYQRHLFVDRRKGDETIYQFHALSRAFLRHRARQDLNVNEQRATASRAAAMLEDEGRIEDAMALHCEARDWTAARGLTLRLAPSLIAQGRWRVVVDWMSKFPREIFDHDCWLQHWLGTAWVAVNPPEARRILETCFATAVRDGDRLCQTQVAAGMIETYFLEYSVFHPADRWIDVLVHILSEPLEFPTVESELRVQSALVIALTYRQPGHPALSRCAPRVQTLVPACADTNLSGFAAFYLGLYGDMCGRNDVAEAAMRMMIPLSDHPDATALTKGMLLAVSLWHCVLTANGELGREVLDRLDRLGERENLHLARRFSCILGFYLDMRVGALAQGQARLRRFEKILIPTDLYETASLLGMQCYYGLFADRPEETLALADSLMEAYSKTGSLCHELFMLAGVIQAHTEVGDHEGACVRIAQYRGLMPSEHMEWMAWGPDTAEAWIALQSGDHVLLSSHLRDLFRQPRPRRFGYGMSQIWCRKWMPDLCAEALQAEIESQNVRDYIREYSIDAPNPLIQPWPWRVKVHTFGRFHLSIDDHPISFSTKAPRKLLALLKAIVSLGGVDVPEERITDALWGDEDGDTAHQSFATALHRLRKLLGDHDLISQRDGKVSLDLGRIWVDALTFDQLCDMAEAQRGAADSEPFLRSCQQAIDLYRGSFLADETDASYALSPRERRRARFLTYSVAFGARLEADGKRNEAQALYRRGLEADELAEAFYQGLMRCHHDEGQTAEAVAIYRRMREVLSSSLGVQPSRATEALYEKLAGT
jgi:DNA-binding SARP family transcriptional activator